MIDVSTYYQLHASVDGRSRLFNADDAFAFDNDNDYTATTGKDPWPTFISVTEESIDPGCVLMVPPTIVGFNMGARSWGKSAIASLVHRYYSHPLTNSYLAWLHVDGISEVTWNDSAFDSLVLDEASKRMLDALINSQSHSSDSSDLVDIVKGKGQGLTILLHGAPGTGKTLTVERSVQFRRFGERTSDNRKRF